MMSYCSIAHDISCLTICYVHVYWSRIIQVSVHPIDFNTLMSHMEQCARHEDNLFTELDGEAW